MLESWPASCWPGCRAGPMVYIYIYKERGFASVFLLGLAAFGDVISYIRCKDSSRAHIFTLHCASGVQTDLSSNSIQQHGVPAWPAGHPIESQHGLLVVQGSISMACWSSKGVSAWPAGRPSPASCSHLPRPFQRTLFNTQPNHARHRLQCVTRAIRQW